MTDDLSAEECARRTRLIDEARALVDRLRDAERHREESHPILSDSAHEPSLPPAEISRRLIPACGDDAVARWAADAERRERERRKAERELRREQRRDRIIRRRYEGTQPAAATRAGDDWNAWCDTRIAEALDRERDALAEGFGEGIAKLLADERAATSCAIRDEIRDLKIEIAKLGSEAAELRAALAGDRSRVVDLPRRNVN